MLVLVTYDVSTTTKAGRRRLRRVAQVCLDYGQRVQNSVFECEVDPTQLETLRFQLLDEVELEEDSIRVYRLGRSGRGTVEHHGTKPTIDLTGPLVL